MVPNASQSVASLLRRPGKPNYDLPWPTDDRRPLVLVSFSTSDMGQADALQRVADALGRLKVRGLLTVGPAMDAGELRLPNNVVAESFVPHARVIRHAALVVTHAGHGTTMTAVTAGVPLRCMPMGRFEASSRTSWQMTDCSSGVASLLAGSISMKDSPRRLLFDNLI
jgi:UDP:flavonoid glycosyltransferase YjiC (YdhE family)